MAKVSLTAGVDARLAAKAVEQAEQEGIPLSVLVERALAQYLGLDQAQLPRRQRMRPGRVVTIRSNDRSQE
jgi:hypothetical protein